MSGTDSLRKKDEPPVGDFEDILVDTLGPVTVIRINRPEARNACRFQTLEELCCALGVARDDADVGAVILTGAGELAFSSGADLKELANLPSTAGIGEGMRHWWRLLDVLGEMRKPVISAVRGHAVGGGTEIALASHIVIAGTSARFGLPEILRGHIPGAGGTVHLPRRIGAGRGLYYLLTGEEIPADAALSMGLVSKVVPDEGLDAAALELANHLSAQSGAAIAALIETVSRSDSLPVSEALAVERELCARLRGSDDFWEGFKAFIEKRPARYGNTRLTDREMGK